MLLLLPPFRPASGSPLPCRWDYRSPSASVGRQSSQIKLSAAIPQVSPGAERSVALLALPPGKEQRVPPLLQHVHACRPTFNTSSLTLPIDAVSLQTAATAAVARAVALAAAVAVAAAAAKAAAAVLAAAAVAAIG